MSRKVSSSRSNRSDSQPGPGNIVVDKPCLESRLPKFQTFENPILGVEPCNKPFLDGLPICAQPVQLFQINRDPIPFHGGGGGHVTSAQQPVSERKLVIR